MKRVLSLLALGLLAGCATYPDYGYYDDGRSYDRYASDGYYEDRYRDGGDYYYSHRPYYGYDDGFYGYGPYGYGYGGYSGYGGYGGYGGLLGYGFGYRPRIGLGFGFSSGGYYPYGGYYGGYYPYGYYGYYAPRRPYRYDRYDHRGGDAWLDARDRSGTRGDGVIDNDASNLADQLARQRGVTDGRGHAGTVQGSAYPPERRSPRERDPTPDDRDGWRSDYRDAQLASPRAAAAGNAYSRDASAPQLRMEQAPTREWRGRSTGRQQNTSHFESAPQARYATPRFDSAPRQQSYAAPRSEPAPQRFFQPAPRFESRSESTSSRSSARERDATSEP